MGSRKGSRPSVTSIINSIKILFGVFISLAWHTASAIGNIEPVEIRDVYVREYRIDIILVQPYSNPLACENNTMLVLKADEFPTSKSMVAAVLGAHIAGKKISGWVGECYDGGGKLNAVNVEK